MTRLFNACVNWSELPDDVQSAGQLACVSSGSHTPLPHVVDTSSPPVPEGPVLHAGAAIAAAKSRSEILFMGLLENYCPDASTVIQAVMPVWKLARVGLLVVLNFSGWFESPDGSGARSTLLVATD